MNELEKMEAGLEYCINGDEIEARNERAMSLCRKYNSIDPLNYEEEYKVLEELLGSKGEHVWIGQPFACNYGKNIFIGNNFTGNFNITMLDVQKITIGDNVMIGPNTLISTVNHPLSPRKRRENLATAKPVTIGNDVWIGGNVTILPGVNIGNNVVIAAGAVVTKDTGDNCVMAGVPAKKVREIENDIQNEEENV